MPWLGNDCADATARQVADWHPLFRQLPEVRGNFDALVALGTFVAEVYESGCEDVDFPYEAWDGVPQPKNPQATQWVPPEWFRALHRLWAPLLPNC
eukprot:1637650-Amphidinium_carterae.1